MYLKEKHTWILGATGYIGRALAEQFLGDRNFVCLGHRKIDLELMERSNFLMSSLEGLDLNWLERFPPKVIFHCARLAGSSPAKRKAAAEKGARANQRIIDYLVKLPYPPTIVYCSGTLMYGPQDEETDEATPLNPIAYARQYEIAERPWLKVKSEGKLDVRMARPAWILGPDSWFLHFFLKPAWEQGWVPYYGDGQQQMSILALADCAGQLKHVNEAGKPGTNYNLYSLPPISQKEFAETLADCLKMKARGISLEDCKAQMGLAETEALCSNIPVTTYHRDWKLSYQTLEGDLTSLLEKTIHQAEVTYGLLRKS